VDEGLERAQWREWVGDDVFDWLEPRGGQWDAALLRRRARVVRADRRRRRRSRRRDRLARPLERPRRRRPGRRPPRARDAPGFPTWEAFLLAQATWGEKNESPIGHPLARAVPALSHWQDMPSVPQAGDADMPYVAASASGQSELAGPAQHVLALTP